ncbi:neural cell adhesion molecule 1 isoform X1 [Anopheles merus]|uniref:neural cell adhesion molecule 1 isoform X1 n=1 Tax=Anopheles merus TaxID=30066 RepID=UPI001BE413D9|nr:neural cell adhesion molecule 1 isoform X1 [Anopheles merus]XP_041760549.1 neural cell adhesion molecule 1 isoform X1 [Anopheles merus]XP_041760550.1 neural cell adhesion molecule 1 isoform X1 [Anopheles merus]XP_041760551.1 neural cell adhesion molecule 1 isoform X1 [Anopheles merus]
MGALNTARWWHQAHPATAISGMMVAARSRSAASGGKNSVHTDGNGGTNEMAKRNGRRAIVTAKCAGDNGSSSSSSSSGGSGIITAVAGHRSQRGVVNCFLRFIFLRNMFILLVVISGLLVSTADAVISSRGSSGSSSKGSSPPNNGLVPRFISRGHTYRAVVGDTLVLPCEVENLGTLVLLWRRGSNVLTASQLMVTRDERIRLVNGYNLEISELEPQDAGDYVCQISDKVNKDQVHTVEILVPPSVRAIPPTGQVTARKGGAVTLECKASGNPVPSIYWTKRTGTGKSAAKIGEGPVLSLERVERQQAGVYQCTADNNVGEPVTVDMRLDVLYPPDISVEKSWIHSGEGFEAQLECIVHADPQPTVSWNQNSFPLQPTDRRTMSSRGNRHTLTIRHVQQEDFGNYSCVADNSLGRSKKYMEVSGRPGPADFLSPPWSRSTDSFNLTWKVESYPPLQEVRLLYRKLMMNETFQQPGRWHDVILTPAPRPPSEPLTHVMAFTLRGLQHSSVYEAIVQAKNRYGWNEVSDIFQFYTQRISSDIHSEEMQVASSTSRSGATTLHRTAPPVGTAWTLLTLLATLIPWLLLHGGTLADRSKVN